MPEVRSPIRPKIINLPQVRRLSWAAMLLESVFQVVLALWTGGLAAVASLAVPEILSSMEDPARAARTCLELLGNLGLLGCGAGSLLLLVSLLMHLLAMRSTRGTFAQTAFLLVMTLIAVGLQVLLAPRLSELVRSQPDLWSARGEALARFQGLFGTYLGLILLQALVGCALLLTGTRRWFRNVRIDAGTESAGY